MHIFHFIILYMTTEQIDLNIEQEYIYLYIHNNCMPLHLFVLRKRYMLSFLNSSSIQTELYYS